ncbi:MAG TPA: ABC transporter ATP-binding protein [Candidatus Baltobacteraceae bacterium]|nr:ABC transporter ATP-binding protein [Candidatus Baltobacteraceae bacterium]
MSESYAIETRDLTKRYGDRYAVADLTVRVARGEVFGFLGPNGAGKTTAVKMLLGLVFATSGDAAILGRPLGSFEARRKIGYLPELFRYQEWLSAREILSWHAALLRLPRSARRRQIDDLLERVGLGSRADDRIAAFSKGMQQRLGLAVALLGTPELIVLDEPTSALDPVGRADVRGLIADVKARGATVFLNSHLLTEVESTCDSAAVILNGRIRAQGTLGDLLGKPGVSIAFANGTSTLLEGVTSAEIPSIVASYVAQGAQIISVIPVRQTLEERFLQIVRSNNVHERSADRVTHDS